MLKIRVIPTILTDGVSVLKGEGFDSWRTIGTIVQSVRVYNSRDVDELVIVDVTARAEGRLCDLDIVETAANESRVPLSVGGGVNSVDDVRTLLHAGADKVIVNSACYEQLEVIERMTEVFGSQCIVASVDVRMDETRGYVCVSHSGSRDTCKAPVEWAVELANRGVGEILLCRVERDGCLVGYDIDLVLQVSQSISIPVIASGGAADYADMARAVVEGGASAVAAGAMFQFTEQTPRGARDYLGAAGLPVRRT